MPTHYYGTLFSTYWTGPTGREIRARGGPAAQLLGVFLLSNDYMNMLGLYRLKVRDVEEDLGLTREAIVAALEVLQATDYAYYDEPSQFVWVTDMARARLQITDDHPLVRKDLRVKGARRVYAALPVNPFLGPFFDRYGPLLWLDVRADAPKVVGRTAAAAGRGTRIIPGLIGAANVGRSTRG
jgi:hypothetical protein